MKIDWQKSAAVLFCVSVAAVGFFLIGKYVFAIAVPFLIAWATALLIRPLADRLAKKTGLPPKLAAVLLLIILFLLLSTLLVLGINRLANELARLLDRFASGDPLTRLVEEIEHAEERIPFLHTNEKLRESLGDIIASLVREGASAAASAVTSFATGLLRATPSIMLFVVVTVISSFYFLLDLDSVHRALFSLLPQKAKEKLPSVKMRVRRFLVKYLRIYLFLMFITFCELFAGFSVLGVDYAFLLALIISVIDILPVLGVGTVLIPWSVIELLGRDFRMGFGLLILWAVITVVRQITEPHIVGETIGLHPLLTLTGMYVGFRIFGIMGMLLAPALIIAVRTGIREWMPQSG